MKTIAIDFDGVIHRYSKGWKDGKIYDVPVNGAFAAIRRLLKNNYRIVIFSTRADCEQRINDMKAWLMDHGLEEDLISGFFPMITITNQKPIAEYYIDDRAIRFTNWREALKEVIK